MIPRATGGASPPKASQAAVVGPVAVAVVVAAAWPAAAAGVAAVAVPGAAVEAAEVVLVDAVAETATSPLASPAAASVAGRRRSLGATLPPDSIVFWCLGASSPT
jgi:hypothetical protein